MIFNCLGIYYVTYSGSTAPCKKMPCMIYCRTAVTVVVLKAWINAELMVGSAAAKLPRLFEVNCTLCMWYKVFLCVLFFHEKAKQAALFFAVSVWGLRGTKSCRRCWSRQNHLELLEFNHTWIPFFLSMKVKAIQCALFRAFVERVSRWTRQQLPFVSVPGPGPPDRRPGSSPRAYRWSHCCCLA